MNKVMHFEIPADNVKRALNFYKKVFDWKIQEIPDMKLGRIECLEKKGQLTEA